MTNLQVRVFKKSEVIWIEIGGEIEMSNAPQLREILLDSCSGACPRLVVDLTRVPFIDSTGIGTLVIGLKRAREKGGTFALFAPQPRVRRVFEISGLMTAFSVFEAPDDAQQYAAGKSNPSTENERGQGEGDDD